MVSHAVRAQKNNERAKVLHALGKQSMPPYAHSNRTSNWYQQPPTEDNPKLTPMDAISASRSMHVVGTQLDRMKSIQVLIAVMLAIITVNIIVFDLGLLYVILQVKNAVEALQESGYTG
jgi:hypothetical protein